MVIQGQKVNIKIYFNDARFNISKPNYDVEIKLMINGNDWPAEYCPINNKKWRENLGCIMGTTKKIMEETHECECEDNYCKGKIDDKEFNITVSQGYGYIEAECIVPLDLPSGSYKITAIPTIYSEPIYLSPAETKIEVSDIFTKIWNSILSFFKTSGQLKNI